MKYLNREIVSEIANEYKEILIREKHHNHAIVMINGEIKWKQNENLKSVDTNEIIRLFNQLGYDENSEVYKKFYRDLGYSLHAYWKIFYCDLHNVNTEEYKPSFIHKVKKTIKNYFSKPYTYRYAILLITKVFKSSDKEINQSKKTTQQ